MFEVEPGSIPLSMIFDRGEGRVALARSGL
jgi:hypothetical protein